MFRWAANWLMGYFMIFVPASLGSAVFDFMLRHGMTFYGEKKDRAGNLRFRLPRRFMGEFAAYAAEFEGWSASELRGFPVALLFLRKRPGILCGALLLLLWLPISSRVVWDVRVTGNTTTPEEEIVALLDEVGCGYGDWIPSINLDDVHARYLAKSDSIGWIAVYLNGVVAEVQVREQIRPARVERAPGVYANVVAKEDGVIESVRVFEGQAAVKAGDVVRAGDVVISGVVERKDGGLRYEYAAGEVLARTVRRIDVEIALEREEKVYTGRETVKKSVKIFGKVVKLFKNTGIAYDKYDTINTTKRLFAGSLCPLPIWVSETRSAEYRLERKTVSGETAAAEGLKALRRAMDEAAAGGEILEKTLATSLENGRYTIACLLYSLRDIGNPVEFTVSDAVPDSVKALP